MYIIGVDSGLGRGLLIVRNRCGARGDAADAEVATRQVEALTVLRSMLAGLQPKPADLIDLEDRLDRICARLVDAGGRAAPER